MSNNKSKLLNRLKHHVTGAIERGETQPIEAVVETKHTQLRVSKQRGYK